MSVIDDCFLVPGPTRMAVNCLTAMSHPTITSRGSEYRAIMARLNSGLRVAFGLSPSLPDSGTESWSGDDDYKVVVVSGSGTAAMEMIIANRFRPNDRVLVPTNGKFGERVAQICGSYCQVEHLNGEWGRTFDHEHMESLLSKGGFEAVLICHNETSSGITQDADAIAELCRKYSVALILDGITSVGGIEVELEKWSVEAAVVGAQKCTAGPSGIAAIAINNQFIDRCGEIRNSGQSNPAYYLDLQAALKKGADDQTPWTPAINASMGWAAALDNLRTEGLDERIARCALMANGVRNLFSDLGFELLADVEGRSDTVTAILYPEGINDSWRKKLQDEYRTYVIGAQDHLKGKMFRIGSMGETPIPEMIEGCQRMLQCFRDCGHDLAKVDVESYFR